MQILFYCLCQLQSFLNFSRGEQEFLKDIKKFCFKFCKHTVYPGALVILAFLAGRNCATERYCSIEKTVLWLKQEKIRLNGLLSPLPPPFSFLRNICMASFINSNNGERDKLEMTQKPL